MKIRINRPSNQFWSILISTVTMIVVFLGIMMFLSSQTSSAGGFGLIMLIPFVFLISLVISYRSIYPKIDEYLDKKYKSNSKKLKIKSSSLILGVILGIITEFGSRFLIWESNYDPKNYVFMVMQLLIQLILQIVFCIIWVRIIDKITNK